MNTIEIGENLKKVIIYIILSLLTISIAYILKEGLVLIILILILLIASSDDKKKKKEEP